MFKFRSCDPRSRLSRPCSLSSASHEIESKKSSLSYAAPGSSPASSASSSSSSPSNSSNLAWKSKSPSTGFSGPRPPSTVPRALRFKRLAPDPTIFVLPPSPPRLPPAPPLPRPPFQAFVLLLFLCCALLFAVVVVVPALDFAFPAAGLGTGVFFAAAASLLVASAVSFFAAAAGGTVEAAAGAAAAVFDFSSCPGCCSWTCRSLMSQPLNNKYAWIPSWGATNAGFSGSSFSRPSVPNDLTFCNATVAFCSLIEYNTPS
mmetsp:Transcript_19221/g.46402  ORF Transcript_19221/g.46402 Transcript_19221/m.46402 type:complete len:260 (+) Transcript_19221:515-1294(+)